MSSEQEGDGLLGVATLVVTDIDAVPSSRNVIPDRVSVVLDWRVLPSTTPDSMMESVRGALAGVTSELADGFTIEVRMARERQAAYTGLARDRDLFTPGFLMDLEHPVVRAAAEAVGRRESSGNASVRPWTFATDGGWSCGVHGIPTIGFAPGEERHAHTNRERLDLAEAEWALERYPHLIVAVQRALTTP